MTQQLLSSPAPRPRPFRVCNWDRSLRKGIMAHSLAELLRQVSWGAGGLSVCLPVDCPSSQVGGGLASSTHSQHPYRLRVPCSPRVLSHWCWMRMEQWWRQRLSSGRWRRAQC